MLKKEILLLMLFVAACTTPEMYLEKQNYDKAYQSSLRKLKKGEQPGQNKQVLETALDKIIKIRYSTPDDSLSEKNLNNIEKELKQNKKMQTKLVDALPFVSNRFRAIYQDLKETEKAITNHLATSYFNLGQSHLENYYASEDKSVAERAYFAFQKSKDFGNTNFLTDSLQKLSYDHALRVYLIETRAPFDAFYLSDINRKFNNLEQKGGYFTKVHYNNSFIDKEKLDCHITITFKSLDIDVKEDEDKNSFEKEIITGQEHDLMNDTVVDVVEKVTGEVVKIKTTKTVSWRVVIDVTSTSKNCNLTSWSFSEDEKCEMEEVVFRGDKRAIPFHYSEGKDGDLKSDDDMVDDLIDDIYRRVVAHIF